MKDTKEELSKLSKEELIDLVIKSANKLDRLSYAINSQQKEIKEALGLLNQYRRSVDESTILIICNKNHEIIYTNKSFHSILEYSNHDIKNKHLSHILRDDHKYEMDNILTSIRQKDLYKGVIQVNTKYNHKCYLNATVIPFYEANGELKKYVCVCFDVTEFYEQKKLVQRQYTDDVTGLFNRQKLIDDLDKLDEFISLGILNIDGFREFNDLYGHQFGDRILQEVGDKISSIIKDKNIVIYKLPADEYALLYNASDTKLFEEKMKELVYTIGKTPILVEKETLHINVTIGVAHLKTNIIAKADIALSDAKKYHLDIFIYDVAQEVEKKYESNIHWIKSLKDAIENDKIITYYQPILNNKTNKIEKYECLVRLIDENDRVIAPYLFLDVSKKSRFYSKLTQRVIAQSFDRFRDNDNEFSINFSIEDIQTPETVEYLFNAIKNFPHPHRVIVEITESEGIQNYEQVAEFIKELHKCNSQVAIDDFGTGYSNFDRILKLNVDYIKIDGSLISDINKNESLKIICETIVLFAKRLGIKIVAEFVSDEGIQAQVIDMGIEYSQGYHIGMPMDTIL